MDWTGTCESVRINSNRLSHHQRTLASEHLPLAGTWPDINHSCARTTAARVCRHCVKHTSPHTHTHTHTARRHSRYGTDKQTDGRVAALLNASYRRRNNKANKKLSYRRGTARCVVSVEILPIATQQCRNYLYDKSRTKYQCHEGAISIVTVRVL